MSSIEFKLSRTRGTPLKESDLIADLKRVAQQLGVNSISQPQYSDHGRYDMRNLSRRFGGWQAALASAGLAHSSYQSEYSDEELFANISEVWQYLGRQPRRAELAFKPSVISQSPYQRRFGSWTSALEAFVCWANASDLIASPIVAAGTSARRTPRDPSLRLRFKILQRDRFTCVACGKSPATDPGTVLHIDHILAWSLGGETILENLKTLCSVCNLGKSNQL